MRNFFNVFSQILSKAKIHRELWAALTSGGLLLIAWLSEEKLADSLWIVIMVIAFVIGGFAKAKEGLLDLWYHHSLSVELLMIIAGLGSAAIGYWTEGAMLIFIFSLSGALESYTMQKSEKELSTLMNLQPKYAVQLTNGTERLVPIEDVRIADLIVIKPGERVATDGIIVKGESSLDESALTGEAIPIFKSKEDTVFAGTMNLTGSLVISITKSPQDSFVQQIITLVQSAQQQKSPAQLFIERFETIYVKIVLVSVSMMLFIPYYLLDWSFSESFYRAMILLVVASPCALVASIMPASLSAISNGARKGILFKGGVHIEQLSNMKAAAFDKTGTLTNGKPTVTDIQHEETLETETLFPIIIAIEKESNHPLAQAIVNDCSSRCITLPLELEHMYEEPGKGVSAIYHGDQWSIGTEQLFSDSIATRHWIKKGQEHAKEAKSIVYFGKNKQILGLIALKDQIRDGTNEVIQAFKSIGIHTVMLTGDNHHTANTIANEIQIDTFFARCMPDDKQGRIKQLKQKYGTIAMIGDGINDAPAMASADIGIAMGAGTDVSIETANIVLMKNELGKIIDAITLSKRMNRVIKQNIFFSIGVIALLIVANFSQLIDLPLGVIGHEGSTILVILNGLRLLK